MRKGERVTLEVILGLLRAASLILQSDAFPKVVRWFGPFVAYKLEDLYLQSKLGTDACM
jgi:hypothetical protein